MLLDIVQTYNKGKHCNSIPDNLKMCSRLIKTEASLILFLVCYRFLKWIGFLYYISCVDT